MSNQGWQDGGMKSKKLEDGSGSGKEGVRRGEADATDGGEFLILDLRFLIGSDESSIDKGADWKVALPGREAGGGWKGRAGKWDYLRKSWSVVGKRTGFAHLITAFTHLGPDNSTQVVDFPHLSVVRVFFGRRDFTAEIPRRREDLLPGGVSWLARSRLGCRNGAEPFT